MSVVLLLLTNSSLSFSDSHTSQFKPHPSSGKYSAIACRSSGNNEPVQFSGNSATAARTFLSPSEIFGGSLRSNADIKITGNGYINGDATPAPGHIVNKTGNATVTGSIQPATELLDCSIGDLTQLISWVQQNNNNSSIPSTNQGRMPWGCGSNPPPNDPWQFCLKGNETIHIPGGIYWFSSWKQSGNSNIIIDGYVRILVKGSMDLSGNLSINANGTPYDLLIFALPDSSFTFQMSGNSILNGLIYSPAISAQLSGQSIINGNLISQDINASGQAKLHRWIDQSMPEITFVAPAATCMNSQNINASITITDNESGIDPESINLNLDGNPVAITVNPADPFWHSVNVQAALSGLSEGNHQIKSMVWDRAGNYSEQTYNLIIDLTPPVIHITMPADGSSLQSNQVLVEGNASDNYRDACGLSLTVNGNLIGIEPDGTWLTTMSVEQGATSITIKAIAQDEAGNISQDQITIASFMAPALHNFFPFSLTIGNGVMEIGREDKIYPAWAYIDGAKNLLNSTASGFQGPDPLDYKYTITDNHDSYSFSPNSYMSNPNDFYIMSIIFYPFPFDPLLPLHHDATFKEALEGYDTSYTWPMHFGNSFLDVGTDNPFYRDIETVLHYGISGTCTCPDPSKQYCYCPDINTTRASTAVMIARALAMGDGNIPYSGRFPMPNDDPASGSISTYSCVSGGISYFGDINAGDWLCRYVHYLYAAGIIQAGNCSCNANLCFCPNDNITRKDMATIIALSISLGDDSLLATYTDPTTQDLPPNNNYGGNILRHYSCDPDDPSKMHFHFKDVDTGALCRYSHYLWARDITSGCGPTTFCPDNNVTRAQLARYIVRAFRLDLYKADIKREFLCPYSGNLSLGDYSIIDSGITDASIDRAVNLAFASGVGRGFRDFLNIDWRNYVPGMKLNVQPYKAVYNSGQYWWDLTQDNPVFWERVDRLVSSMKIAGFKKKPVFTINTQYQCNYDGWIGPWCHNVNKFENFKNPGNQDNYCSNLPVSCTGDIIIAGDSMSKWKQTNFACSKEWIKCQYVKLAQKFMQHGVDTIEIYNESALNTPSVEGHQDIITAIKTAGIGIKIQVDFNPLTTSCTDPSPDICENDITYPSASPNPKRSQYEAADFAPIWDNFTTPDSNWRVDYFSVHNTNSTTLHWLTDSMLSRTNANGERILELSTDAQYDCGSYYNHPLGYSHHMEAEIIKKLMDKDIYPGINFENDFESLQFTEKIRNVCYRDNSKVMVDIRANCNSDGPACIETPLHQTNIPCTNVIVWTSINADYCEITPHDSQNSHWNNGLSGAGWEFIPWGGSKLYTLHCWTGSGDNQKDYYDYVRANCKSYCP